MKSATSDVSTLDELREFVNVTLCEKENLVRDQFRMLEMELTRGGRFCGRQFSIHGPRQVRLSAVWASEHNVVYFYDTTGVRFMKVQLTCRIPDESAKAA